MATWDPLTKIDELRKMANTDYFDVMLLHWQHLASWPADSARWKEGIMQAQEKKAVITRRRQRPRTARIASGAWKQVAGCGR